MRTASRSSASSASCSYRGCRGPRSSRRCRLRRILRSRPARARSRRSLRRCSRTCASTRPRLRPLVVVAVVVGLALSPFAFRGHVRSQYWRVAVHEANAHPVAGSGAGTFSNWWLEKRHVPLSTQEAHALYLETLAELGPVGLALLLTALAVPLAAAVRIREPALAAALVAYDVGAAVDFHWELAGVTVPVSPARRDRRRARVEAWTRGAACGHRAGLRNADGGGASRLRGRCTACVRPRCTATRRSDRRRRGSAKRAPLRAVLFGCVGRDRRLRVELSRLPPRARARPERLEPLGAARERLER